MSSITNWTILTGESRIVVPEDGDAGIIDAGEIVLATRKEESQ
jgi:hypothetical protein